MKAYRTLRGGASGMPARAAMLVGLLAACSPSPAPVEAPRPVMVVQPRPIDYSYQVFSGEVRARFEPALAFRVPGKILKRHVDVGARVNKGQLLAELDPADLRLQAEGAGAQLAAAEADLSMTRNERDRHRELLERDLISQSLFDARETQFQAAAARLRQARAQLEVARNQSAYAQLRASDAGLIAQRHAEAGQVVAAGQTVFVLAAEGDREVLISLPEHEIESFAIGMPVVVALWSNPDQRLPGRLRELAPTADAGARTFAARIEVTDQAGLELGSSARVLFVRAQAPALALPLPAVTAQSGGHYVLVVDPSTSTLSRREVTIGPFGDNDVPITAGLAAADWVVAAGLHLLHEGQKVAPVDRDNRGVSLVAPVPPSD